MRAGGGSEPGGPDPADGGVLPDEPDGATGRDAVGISKSAPQWNRRRTQAQPGLAGPNRTPPVKDVGEPCAGEPHARFDGRGLETDHHGVTAPAPDPTNLARARAVDTPQRRVRTFRPRMRARPVRVHSVQSHCPRSARPRSWPRPATSPGSPPPARWSSTPGWRLGNAPPAPTPAGLGSDAPGDPGCAGGLARRLGDHQEQPGLRRPVHPSDHPRDQPAVRRAGPRGDRSGDPAAPAHRGHPPPSMGPRHCVRPPNHLQHRESSGSRRLNTNRPAPAVASRGGRQAGERGKPHAA